MGRKLSPLVTASETCVGNDGCRMPLHVVRITDPSDAVIAFSLLTFFYSACGLALRAVLRTFTSRREDVSRHNKVSKEKAMTASDR